MAGKKRKSTASLNRTVLNEEENILKGLVIPHLEVLENKSSDPNCIRKKVTKWKVIAEEMIAYGYDNDWNHFKKLWIKMKKNLDLEAEKTEMDEQKTYFSTPEPPERKLKLEKQTTTAKSSTATKLNLGSLRRSETAINSYMFEQESSASNMITPKARHSLHSIQHRQIDEEIEQTEEFFDAKSCVLRQQLDRLEQEKLILLRSFDRIEERKRIELEILQLRKRTTNFIEKSRHQIQEQKMRSIQIEMQKKQMEKLNMEIEQLQKNEVKEDEIHSLKIELLYAQMEQYRN